MKKLLILFNYKNMNKIFYKLIVISFLFASCAMVNAQNREELKAFKVAWNRWGFVNSNNDTIIKPTYRWAYDFHDGIALVQDGTSTDPEKYGQFGYINEKNEYVVEPISMEPFHYKDGLVIAGDKETLKIGFVNFKKELVIPYKYDEAHNFGFAICQPNGFNDLAIVNIGNSIESRYTCILSEGKWGLINKKGEEVLPIKYGYIYGVSCDVAFIFDGEFVFHQTSESGGGIVEFKGKFGIIDSDGKIIVSPIYDEIVGDEFFIDGIATVKKDGKEFKINTKGEVIE